MKSFDNEQHVALYINMPAPLNLVGTKYGRLLVLFRDDSPVNKQWSRPETMWKCLCDCGSLVSKRTNTLRMGYVNSCGCLRKETTARLGNKNKGPKRVLEKGQKFGRLIATGQCRKESGGLGYRWKFDCSCGEVRWLRASAVMSGGQKSCGCLRNEQTRQRATARRGKAHPSYRHDIPEPERAEGRKNRTVCDTRLRRCRRKAFMRDNFTCQKCKTIGGRLAAHHLRNWRDNPKLRYVLSNLVTVCVACHKRFHKLFGLRNTTREQFLKFLKE